MTLNITVLSPSGIHQSADFRISETERDDAGNWITLQENSAKIVSLTFENWSGLLTYCGAGLWKSKRTDAYAMEWLAQAPWDATFHDALEIIRAQGSRWITGINEALGERRRHSFILAGFEAGIVRYAVISNYETLNGEISPIAKDLQVDAGSTTGVHVLVTGIRDAVPDEDCRLLKHLAETGRELQMIQSQLANTNQKAALSSKSRNGIGVGCLTYTCDRNGAQHSRLHGDVPGPLVPATLVGGIVSRCQGSTSCIGDKPVARGNCARAY
jgi:hypothetical protein